jgi:hypothetical protein
MNIDLSDEEATALTQELHDIIESDRYPFSPRIRTLRAVLAKLRLEPDPAEHAPAVRRGDARPRMACVARLFAVRRPSGRHGGDGQAAITLTRPHIWPEIERLHARVR